MTEASFAMALHPRRAWIGTANFVTGTVCKTYQAKQYFKTAAYLYMNTPDAICAGAQFAK